MTESEAVLVCAQWRARQVLRKGFGLELIIEHKVKEWIAVQARK